MSESCSLFDTLHTVGNPSIFLTMETFAGKLLTVCRRTLRRPVTVFASSDGKDPNPMSHEPTEEEWRKLACLASEEKDPYKVVELARQIVEMYDEEERATAFEKGKKRKLERVLGRINGRNPSL